MKSKWITSILSTTLIWVLGVLSFFLISDWVPAQLHIESSILTEIDASKEDKEEKSVKEIIHQTQKSVVMIEVERTGSVGSGFIYNNQGDIITNAHVVAGTDEVKVKLADTREYDGTVIGMSTDTDIALIRVPDIKDIEPLPLAKDYPPELGDEVLAIGSPLGYQNTVTTGIISGVDRSFEIDHYQYENAYQFSAPIAPGNSGGPLILIKSGKVIGINSAATEVGTIGFSIPIIDILPLVTSWSETPMTSLPSMEYSVNEDQIASSIENIATYLVQYFYDSIDQQDYVNAYSLLGSSWQLNTSYEQFREGYLNTGSVIIDDIYTRTEGETVTVFTIIHAEERQDKEVITEKYQVEYKVGYENDQLKLISGTGEIIE
ncbi:S1C family serine protease [Alkalihalobacterium chitinilyticum]|uniref:S1C family serine protease n=1 Tax=Alkalihalobacterium chitinilyticum TaxID=2980103 RepID=A0ABT5V9E9_9BACI|nr:trypsin-like peptidase domain-containing protein [Alkalihalobacterium chitinilyticum]MDE5412088.1 S1C family serine protease [Alkalihalobacterium chitinilyticum]